MLTSFSQPHLPTYAHHQFPGHSSMPQLGIQQVPPSNFYASQIPVQSEQFQPPNHNIGQINSMLNMINPGGQYMPNPAPFHMPTYAAQPAHLGNAYAPRPYFQQPNVQPAPQMNYDPSQQYYQQQQQQQMPSMAGNSNPSQDVSYLVNQLLQKSKGQ